MARTAAGRAFTEEHRRGQLRIRARAAQDFARLWPLWQGDRSSFNDLATAAVPLVRVHRGLSASLAGAYFETFRGAERVRGGATPRLADPVDEGALRGTLFAVGEEGARKAIAAGHSPQAAMQNALVRTTGTVTRFVLDGGRDTMVLSTASDREARGWSRVTAGDPCAFCAMLASRGPVYSEDTSDFQAHDHCVCMGEPAYDGSEWPGRGREFRDLYNRAQREARESGGSEGTANDALNNFRRLLAG